MPCLRVIHRLMNSYRYQAVPSSPRHIDPAFPSQAVAAPTGTDPVRFASLFLPAGRAFQLQDLDPVNWKLLRREYRDCCPSLDWSIAGSRRGSNGALTSLQPAMLPHPPLLQGSQMTASSIEAEATDGVSIKTNHVIPEMLHGEGNVNSVGVYT